MRRRSAAGNVADCGRSVDPRLLRRGLIDNGYKELSVTSQHPVSIDTLPPLHRDPFDRLLLSQAITDGIALFTTDERLARFPGRYARSSNRATVADGSRVLPCAALTSAHLRLGQSPLHQLGCKHIEVERYVRVDLVLRAGSS